MNAKELFKRSEDGTFEPTNVFYCGKCRSVYRSEAQAEGCCKLPTCSQCGVGISRHVGKLCDACWEEQRKARTQAQFDAAKKVAIEDYRHSHVAHAGEYFEVACLNEEFECNPGWVWAVKPERLQLRMIEDDYLMSDDFLPDDQTPDDVPGFAELMADLNARIAQFNEQQEPHYFFEDTTVAVVISDEWWREGEDDDEDNAQ
jgi:hypothetical protein